MRRTLPSGSSAAPALGLVLCFALSACAADDHAAPSLAALMDQTAHVGIELSLVLRADDVDGDSLHFDFDVPALPDLKTRINPATLTSFPDGLAVFRWSPVAADRAVTPYSFNFSASDSAHVAREPVHITVDATRGDHHVFLEPLGGGLTLDLSHDRCASVPVLVEDADSSMVTIAEEPPVIPGAVLQVSGPFAATWTWCPTAAQAALQDHYALRLSASSTDDGEKIVKTFFILIHR